MTEPGNRSSIIFIAIGVLLIGALFAGLALTRGSNERLAGQTQEQAENTDDGGEQNNQSSSSQNQNSDREAQEREQQAKEEREREAAAEKERREREAQAERDRQEAENGGTGSETPPLAVTGPSNDDSRDDAPLPATGPAEDFVMLSAMLTLVAFGTQRLIKSRLNFVRASKS